MKVNLSLIGFLVGITCGFIILSLKIDNYGILSLPSGIFTSLYVISSLLFLESSKNIDILRILSLPMYTITATFSWYLLSKLFQKNKVLLILYIIFWILIGFYATFIIALAYA